MKALTRRGVTFVRLAREAHEAHPGVFELCSTARFWVLWALPHLTRCGGGVAGGRDGAGPPAIHVPPSHGKFVIARVEVMGRFRTTTNIHMSLSCLLSSPAISGRLFG